MCCLFCTPYLLPLKLSLCFSSLTLFSSFLFLVQTIILASSREGPLLPESMCVYFKWLWELTKAFLPRGVLKAEHCVALCPNTRHFHQKSFKSCTRQKLWMPGLLGSILHSAQSWTEACPSWVGPHHPHQQFLVISEALLPLKCVVQHKQACLHDQSLPCTFS